MKKLRLKKIIAGALVAVSALSLNPVGVDAAWKQNSNGWWWYTEGNSWATGWRLIDGKWYHFDSKGYMDYGTVIDGYILNESGAWDKSEETVNSIGDGIFNLTRKLTKAEAQMLLYYRLGDHLRSGSSIVEYEGRECLFQIYVLRESAVYFAYVDLNTGEVSIDGREWTKYTKSKNELQIPTAYGWVSSK